MVYKPTSRAVSLSKMKKEKMKKILVLMLLISLSIVYAFYVSLHKFKALLYTI